MKTLIRMFLLVLGLCGGMLAHANTVTWNLGGKITTATGGFGVAVGDQVNVLLSFDTLAGLNMNPGRSDIPNGKYWYYANSLTMDIWVNGVERGFNAFDPTRGGSIILRNNAPFSGQTVDGISFGLNEADDNNSLLSLAAILRGTDLGVLNSGALPSSPPPGLLNEETHLFQACRSSSDAPGSCDLGEADVTLDSIFAVPEPASLSLVALALAMLGVMPRRAARVRR